MCRTCLVSGIDKNRSSYYIQASESGGEPPGGTEADIERNAIADDSMVCHGTQPTGRAPGLQQAKVPTLRAEGTTNRS
jgi:hypothetical protein